MTPRRRRRRAPSRFNINIDRRAIAAVISMICSAVVMTMPNDNIIWSLAIGLQGGLQGYLGIKKET